MLTMDLSPLYRSTVGFDRVAEALESAMRLGTAGGGYPPYDIEKTGEDNYRITLAVAGFTEDDLKIEIRNGTLVIAGESHADGEEGKVTYLHHGIAGRAFERRFQLADYVQVKDATLSNGLLSVDLERQLPEELKPRRIAISAGAPRAKSRSAPKMIEGSTTKAA